MIVGHSLGATGLLYAFSKSAVAERAVLVSPMRSIDAFLRGVAFAAGFDSAAADEFVGQVNRVVGVDADDLDGERLASKRLEPALVIHDREDRQASAADGQRIAAAWPDARFLTTEGLGHQRLLANEYVCQEITAFCKNAGESSAAVVH